MVNDTQSTILEKISEKEGFKLMIKFIRRSLVFLIIGLILYQLYDIGWREVVNSLPSHPIFYILFCGFLIGRNTYFCRDHRPGRIHRKYRYHIYYCCFGNCNSADHPDCTIPTIFVRSATETFFNHFFFLPGSISHSPHTINNTIGSCNT